MRQAIAKCRSVSRQWASVFNSFCCWTLRCCFYCHLFAKIPSENGIR